MIRVLQVLSDLVPYGAERVVATLASEGLYAEAPGDLSADLRNEGVQLFHLDNRRGFDPRMFNRIFGVLREFRPDVIHTHNYVLRSVLPPALLHNAPVIVHTIHNVTHLKVDRVGVWLQRRSFGRSVHPVAIAEEGAARFERVYSVPRRHGNSSTINFSKGKENHERHRTS